MAGGDAIKSSTLHTPWKRNSGVTSVVLGHGPSPYCGLRSFEGGLGDPIPRWLTGMAAPFVLVVGMTLQFFTMKTSHKAA